MAATVDSVGEVADSDTEINDEVLVGLIDAGRR